MGQNRTERDTRNRTTLLSSFMALPHVDPEFRRILRKIAPPKDREISRKSLDERLWSEAESVLNRLGTACSGKAHPALRRRWSPSIA